MAATNVLHIITFTIFTHSYKKVKMRIGLNNTYANKLLYKIFVHNTQAIILHIETSHKVIIIKTITCSDSRQYAPNVKAHLN